MIGKQFKVSWLQIMSTVVILFLIAGGIVLNTDLALANLCGTTCYEGYTCPTVCASCDHVGWCCNGEIYVRCHVDVQCQYAWCQS